MPLACFVVVEGALVPERVPDHVEQWSHAYRSISRPVLDQDLWQDQGIPIRAMVRPHESMVIHRKLIVGDVGQREKQIGRSAKAYFLKQREVRSQCLQQILFISEAWKEFVTVEVASTPSRLSLWFHPDAPGGRVSRIRRVWADRSIVATFVAA